MFNEELLVQLVDGFAEELQWPSEHWPDHMQSWLIKVSFWSKSIIISSLSSRRLSRFRSIKSSLICGEAGGVRLPHMSTSRLERQSLTNSCSKSVSKSASNGVGEQQRLESTLTGIFIGEEVETGKWLEVSCGETQKKNIWVRCTRTKKSQTGRVRITSAKERSIK